jgi:PAS domain S-box-containing protein
VNDRAKTARGARSAAAVTTLLQSVCDRLPVGFALFDGEFELAAWNARFAALGGYPRTLVKAGTPLESFVRFDVERGGHGVGAIDPLTRQRLAALKRGKRTEREQALPDGRILHIASELVPGAGVLLTCEDVTENRGNEERLRASAARYELALRGISEGFYDWNIANDTVHYSERVRHAVGLSPEELKTPGDWFARIHPEDQPKYRAASAAHFKGQTERFECDYRYRGRDGSWRWARQHGVALRDASGRAYRMVGSTGDITELKRVEEALRESEERHALAMRAAVEGIYEWNVETDALFLSDQAKAFFASPAEKLGPKDWSARIHPEDLERYRRAAVDYFKGHMPHLELEYRVRDAAGGYRWVLDRGIALRDAEGRVTRLIGALSDVTQRKLAEIELRRARDEATAALAEQTALREVLEAISRSAFDLDAVLRALIEHATRLVGAEKGFIFRLEGDAYRLAVDFGASAEFRDFVDRNPIRPGRGTLVGRTALERRTVHIEDAAADPEYRWPESLRRGGFRTMLGVPMVREGAVVGVIALWKEHVEPFTRAQIDLVTTFSNQALIAIENARLFNETREALDQQRASAEVLSAISSSIADARPVFDKILERCQGLFSGRLVGINLVGDDGLLGLAAYHGPGREELERVFPLAINRDSGSGRSIVDRCVIHYPDAQHGADVPEATRRGCTATGIKSVIFAPMLWEERGVGAIFLGRERVGSFSEKEIALLKSFADQAVIAIQNARLFNETREALDQQTATAEILKVMSGSPTDVQPVFEAIVQAGIRLFENAAVAVVRPDGGQVRLMAIAERDPARAEMWRGRFPFPLTREYMHGAAILDCTMVDVPDVLALTDRFQAGRRNFLASGYRAMTVAPMVRDGVAIGTISVIRMAPGPLTDKQLALLKTFADQAVIAIENVRLFNETKEALDQQKASAEVLQVISSSVADTKPVFDKILESCERLFAGRGVGINLVGSDGAVHLGPYRGPGRPELERLFPLPLTRESASGSAILERRVMHYPDVEGGADVPVPVRRAGEALGFKAMLFAPMLWEGQAIGTIFVHREFAGPFSDKEIGLLKTFADQSVIAIQNARLFREIREKSRQLEIADQHKSAFLANMSHELRTPLNAVIGFSEMLTARYFGDLTAKQAEYVGDIRASGKHLLSLINDILDLSKIEAGRMELELDEFDLPAALDNALTLVRERAQRGGVALRLDADPQLRSFRADERKLKQVMLNLLSNAVKFTPGGGSVSVVAKQVDGTAEIAVSDTGVGIAPEDQEAIFEAFRQVGTDVTRKREGTGLGLALARRFVELHGGTIRVASAPGKGSTFTVTLPIRHGE